MKLLLHVEYSKTTRFHNISSTKIWNANLRVYGLEYVFVMLLVLLTLQHPFMETEMLFREIDAIVYTGSRYYDIIWHNRWHKFINIKIFRFSVEIINKILDYDNMLCYSTSCKVVLINWFSGKIRCGFPISINVHMCAHCEIFVWCIVELVRYRTEICSLD